MSMHINLSLEMTGFINNLVASGFYANATEVIRDAIRRMQTEETRFSAWKAAIQQGDNQLNRGEGIPYTTDTLKDITQTAINTMHSSLPMDRDVLP